jgi:hypothetical protein
VNGAIGDLLPAALTIFISPMPITALLLVLLSRQGIALAVAYAGGWVLGIGLEVALFTVLGGVAFAGSGDAKALVGGLVDLAVAATMLTMAAVAWHGRPHDGVAPKPPAWMATIDHMSWWSAMALALVFAVFSPVNLSVTAGAGAALAGAGLGAVATTLVALVFVAVGTASITGPVVAFAVARDRVRSPLEALRSWLLRHNATVLTVLLLVIGATFLGRAIGALWT